MNETENISKEKLEWLKSVDAVKFEQPMTWSICGKYLLSDNYLSSTPLDKLKDNYEKTIPLET